MRKGMIALAATMLTMPITGVASALPCITGSVQAYTAPGFECSVGPVSFSNMLVTIPIGAGTSILFGNFTPFTTANHYGLSLDYSVQTGTNPNASTNMTWTYTVSAQPGFLLSDVFRELSGDSSGTGAIGATETLSSVSPVPVPGALILMGSVVAGGAVVVRRRRKQA
jgi:hypothetical protein